MPGIHHVFVEGIRANKNVEGASITGRFQRLHIDQADNNWCGPASLAQAAMLLRGWNRRVAANSQATSPPWKAFWNRVRSHCNEGTDESDITSLARILSLEVRCTKTGSARVVGELVSAAIRAGHVPLVRTTTKRWSHWAMVSGLAVAADGTPSTLLLLDTSVGAPWAVPYNAIQQLHPCRPRDANFRYEGGSVDGAYWRARFDSVVIVLRDTGMAVRS